MLPCLLADPPEKGPGVSGSHHHCYPGWGAANWRGGQNQPFRQWQWQRPAWRLLRRAGQRQHVQARWWRLRSPWGGKLRNSWPWREGHWRQYRLRYGQPDRWLQLFPPADEHGQQDGPGPRPDAALSLRSAPPAPAAHAADELELAPAAAHAADELAPAPAHGVIGPLRHPPYHASAAAAAAGTFSGFRWQWQPQPACASHDGRGPGRDSRQECLETAGGSEPTLAGLPAAAAAAAEDRSDAGASCGRARCAHCWLRAGLCNPVSGYHGSPSSSRSRAANGGHGGERSNARSPPLCHDVHGPGRRRSPSAGHAAPARHAAALRLGVCGNPSQSGPTTGAAACWCYPNAVPSSVPATTTCPNWVKSNSVPVATAAACSRCCHCCPCQQRITVCELPDPGSSATAEAACPAAATATTTTASTSPVPELHPCDSGRPGDGCDSYAAATAATGSATERKASSCSTFAAATTAPG